MYYTYVIKSVTTNYLYKGITKDIEKRLERHNKGYERTTRAYRPFKLILLESFNSRKEARKREKFLKLGIGRELLKKRADVVESVDTQP